MSLSILNNISALYAENNLNSTQSSLQTTLQQLSSGSRINSGADDPAGLAVSDGLGANEAALTQSSRNASDGIGLLQTADGALSQVTSLLDQAVTLATESANGTLTSGQVSSANQEYQNILSQIGNIGSTTNFNSSNVFSATATNIVVSDGTTGGLNVYADTVGTLNTASVGTTAAASITASAIAPTLTTPTVATATTAGQYTFTPNAASDNLSGNLSFAVGAGTTTNVTVAAGTSLTALKNQLNGNSSFSASGLTASLNGGSSALIITGPSSGANAAANTVSFTGTTLSDGVNASLAPTVGTSAIAATPATSTLTFGGTGVVAGDSLSGSLTFKVGSGAVQSFALAASTTLDAAATTGIVSQLNAVGSSFQAAGLTASISGTVLTVAGPAGTNETIALGAGSVADTTHTGATITNNSVTGAAGTAGIYSTGTLTASTTFTSGDSLTINGGTAIDLSGETGLQAAASITTAGGSNYSAAFTSNKLIITGNATTGAALSIVESGTFTDAASDSTLAFANPTPAVAGTQTTSSLALPGASVAAGDTLSGSLTYKVGSAATATTFTVAAGTTLDSNGTTGITTQLNANQAFRAAGLTASLSGNTLVVKGSNGNSSAIVLTAGSLVDTTNPVVTPSNNTATGAAGTAATNTITLNSASDVLGGSVNINSNGLGAVNVALAGLNGAQAALAITNNATLSSQGVSASWSATNKVLTINGNSSGSSLVVSGSSLTDNALITGATGTVQAAGGPSTGATSTITLGSANDTVAGTLNLVVGNSGLAKDNLSLTIAADTTGSELVNQINGNTSFQAAGVSAGYNSSTYAVTLTGPTGTTNTLATTGTWLIDSSSAVPQAGANFTASTVSTLTAATASTVLTTVTAAVADVAYQRGTIGADVNELTSASNVASAEEVNLTSAQDTITATDYGAAASNLSKYQILSQTGISALAQANSVQQEVLKLLQ
jgi:flagellin